MIIYSPLIEEVIPAFTMGSAIKISFQHNPAVSNYNGMSLRIIDFASNTIITTVTLTGSDITSPAEFPWTELLPHTYYKFQIAYIDQPNERLYYSTVGVGKCVSAAAVIGIAGLITGNINYNPKIYKGVYTPQDSSEPAYWYRFEFYSGDQIIQDTGLLLATGDMTCELRDSLEYNKIYTVKFTVVTVNGLEEAIEYKIIKAGEYPMLFSGSLVATPNYEEAYIELSLVGDTPIKGDFRIYRSIDGRIWDTMVDSFHMASIDDLSSGRYKWRDYAVLQGNKYYYGLAQLADGVISLKKVTYPVSVEYEDMYLSDGDKQLKIRFDPKVSSFKTVVSEAKTDTIGSKYPFFSKNAAVGYKEFPISGLISYQMDNNQIFMTDDELGLSNFSQSRAGATAAGSNELRVRTTSLTDYNYSAERTFKLKVLEWLNNGKPKFFRSPSEGNYVVRLMNVSLSPNDTLGRMIHTFNCTAYECDNSDYATLKAKHLIPEPKVDKTEVGKPVFTSYLMQSAPGSDFVLTGPADNLVYETLYPSTETKFTINGSPYHVTGTSCLIGTLKAGETFIVPWSEANAYASITYSHTLVINDPADDNFKAELEGSSDVYETPSIINSGDYIYIYSISATANTDGTLTIGTNTISLMAGETKAFTHIDGQTAISTTGDITLTVCARKKGDL